jgi:hypothetical protein
MEYCRVSWTEAWGMSIAYRKWLIERKKKEEEKKAEAQKKAQKQAPSKPSRKR